MKEEIHERLARRFAEVCVEEVPGMDKKQAIDNMLSAFIFCAVTLALAAFGKQKGLEVISDGVNNYTKRIGKFEQIVGALGIPKPKKKKK